MTDYFKHKVRGKQFGTIVGWILLGTIAVIGFALLFGLGIMWLWNWLMPDLFGLISINYWQAVGIFILAKVLFGFGGGGHHDKKKRGRRKSQCGPNNRGPYKNDFSKWKFYEKFWEEEGETAFKEFVERKKKDN